MRPTKGGKPADGPLLIARTAQPADPYRPTAALDTLVRGLFLTCTIPGCERPAWACEIDHVQEYNPIHPDAGGPTCACNTSPKCKFHHLLKTHAGTANPAETFLDEQWIADDGTVWTSTTTPHWITRDSPAPGQWLFPQLSGARCIHAPPAHQTDASTEPESSTENGRGATQGSEAAPPERGGLTAATAHKHAWRRRQRARLARDRRRADEEAGPPPF